MGGARQSRAPARIRQTDDSRAHRRDRRYRQLSRDRHIGRRRRVRAGRRLARIHAVELRVRYRGHRRTPRHSLGRRLYGARRLGRRVDRRQAPTRRGTRARTASAARTPRRRHGRRRLGQDDRDRGTHLHPPGTRLGNGRRPSGGARRRCRLRSVGGRHRRRPRCDVALLADRARHRADDDRGSRAGRLGKTRRRVERGARSRAHPHAQRRDRRRGRERSRSVSAHRRVPVVSAVERRRVAAGSSL